MSISCQLLCVCKHRRVNEELRGYFSPFVGEIFARLLEGERVHASIRSLRNRFQGMEVFSSIRGTISPNVVQTQMDRARSWNSIAFHPSIPFIPRQKSPIVPARENTRANLDFPFFSLSLFEIFAPKYSPDFILFSNLCPWNNNTIEV